MLRSRSDRSFMRHQFVNLAMTLTLLATAILLPTQTAKAATPVYEWSSWELRVDFPAGAVNALFIVRVGHYSPDSSGAMMQVVDLERGTMVPCTPQGDVTIGAGSATFRNTTFAPGHILCDLPNFAGMVSSMTGGTYSLGSMASMSNPWVTANLQPTPGDPHAGPVSLTENPVFYHPEIQISTPYGAAAGKAHLNFVFGGNQVISDSFTINSPWNNLWAGAVEPEIFGRVGFWTWASHLIPADIISLSGFPLMANSSPLAVSTALSGSPFYVSTGKTTVCIGCNLDAGTYFDGTINKLAVDPGPGNFSNH